MFRLVRNCAAKFARQVPLATENLHLQSPKLKYVLINIIVFFLLLLLLFN